MNGDRAAVLERIREALREPAPRHHEAAGGEPAPFREWLPPVEPMLKDQTSYVRVKAAGALYSLNDMSGLQILQDLAAAEQPASRLIALQAIVNIGMTTALLPNKGMPLPFISYGGSNLVFCLLCTGILINIYRRGLTEKEYNRGSAKLEVKTRKRLVRI